MNLNQTCTGADHHKCDAPGSTQPSSALRLSGPLNRPEAQVGAGPGLISIVSSLYSGGAYFTPSLQDFAPFRLPASVVSCLPGSSFLSPCSFGPVERESNKLMAIHMQSDRHNENLGNQCSLSVCLAQVPAALAVEAAESKPAPVQHL